MLYFLRKSIRKYKIKNCFDHVTLIRIKGQIQSRQKFFTMPVPDDCQNHFETLDINWRYSTCKILQQLRRRLPENGVKPISIPFQGMLNYLT